MATKKRSSKKNRDFRVGRKVFVGVFVAIFGVLSFITLGNPEFRDKLTGAATKSNVIVLYTNGNKTTKLTASERIMKWSSSNTNVATVDQNGVVSLKKRGEATITGISQTNRQYRFIIEGRTRVIMFMQASQGGSMQKGYPSHTNNGFTYTTDDQTLIYHYNPGCGICWLTSTSDMKSGGECGKKVAVRKGDLSFNDKPTTEPGPVSGVKLLDKTYKLTKKYVELYLFFGLSGNSLQSLSCNTNNDKAAIINGKSIPKTPVFETYEEAIKLYDNAADYIKKAGYTNTKVHIVSIYPIDYTEASKTKGSYWVASTNSNSCKAGYASNYKRYYANKVAETTIKNSYSGKITYIDMFSEFVKRKDNTTTNMDWIGSHDRYNTIDGQHMNYGKDPKTGTNGNYQGNSALNTASTYTKRLFEKAGL